MKKIIIAFLALASIGFTSCSPIQVFTDYEKTATFDQYKTYGYSKESLDQLEISDIDKKRIMRAIDNELSNKSFTKSEKPDLVVHIFTKSNQRVDVFQNNFGWGWGGGWGWGWGPGWGWGGTNVSSVTEGTLYIDFVDINTKELVWQGQGIGVLSKNPDKKEENIQEFVTRILAKYPPTAKK